MLTPHGFSNYSDYKLRILEYDICHSKLKLKSDTTSLALPFDTSCEICYPPPPDNSISKYFKTFWSWINFIQPVKSFTSTTVSALSNLRYEVNKKNVQAPIAYQLAESIIFSIRYSDISFRYPLKDFIDLIAVNAFNTKGFEIDPRDYWNKNLEDSIPSETTTEFEVSSKPSITTMDADQLKQLLDQLTSDFTTATESIVKAIPKPATTVIKKKVPKSGSTSESWEEEEVVIPVASAGKEYNFVKIQTFLGEDDKDAMDWVRQFTIAAEANN